MSGTRQKFWTDIPARLDVRSLDDEKGTLRLSGYASTWTLDRDGEKVAPDAYDGSFDAYLSNNPILLYQHNPDWPIGRVDRGKIDKDVGLAVSATVPKPAEGEIPQVVTAYNKIKHGHLRTFSVGGFFEKAVKSG